MFTGNFNLSTILGTGLVVFTSLQHAFPNQAWIGSVAAGLSLIVMQETPPTPISAPKPPEAA